MIYVFIIGLVAVIATAIVYAVKTAPEVKEEEGPIFQPRKITFIVSENSDIEKPKRKKKKYYNKKKKAAVAENAPTEKRPVGRPRKTTE